MLKNYEASLKLNGNSSHYEARKLLVNLFLLVVAKLQKLVGQVLLDCTSRR